MGNYEQLKQSVSDVIKTNDNHEITGSILQNVLLTIISSVGANATFAGIATPTTNPGTPDGPVFYLASESGTYSNFGSIVVGDEVAILTISNGSWVKIETEIAPKEYVNFIVSQLSKYIGIVASKGIYSIGENVLTKDDFDLSGYPRIRLSFRYVNQVKGCIAFRDINENDIFALYLSDPSATETFTVNIPENFDHAVVVFGAIEITQPIVNVVLINSALFNLHDTLFTDFAKTNSEIQASIIPFNNNGWLNSGGSVISDGNGWNTNFIPVVLGDSFKYNGATQYNNPCIYVMYDINKRVIEYKNTPGTYTDKIVEITNNRVRYIRFSSYITKPTVQRINEKVSIDDKISELESLFGVGNILYGKKYVACGDSFTAGDFTGYVDKDGKSGTDSDAYDKLTGKWKVYPWWITQRNNMQYLNLAVSGSYMHSGSNSFCDSRYLQIPEDADYITFMFGLNELSVDVGTPSSTDKTTLWGSWNFVLEWVLTNRPKAKIGIIISDAWLDQAMHDNLVAIAEYWGIPYLDLKGDPNIPLQIGGRLNNIQVGQKAISLRNSQYQVSSTNSHPNPESHKNRSSIVENFLRSL